MSAVASQKIYQGDNHAEQRCREETSAGPGCTESTQADDEQRQAQTVSKEDAPHCGNHSLNLRKLHA